MFTNINGTILNSFVVHKLICGGDDNIFLAKIVATSLGMCGMSTIMMVTFGIRQAMFH